MHEARWIQRYIAPLVSAPGAAALKDDVALLTSTAEDTIVTTDMLVEGRHFFSSDPLSTVGQKLLRVSVSDIYAKGALPGEALLSIAWPTERSEAEFAALMDGIGADLLRFGVKLIGGDLVSTSGDLVLNLVLTGVIKRGALPRRTGARPGYSIWISGDIGHGGLGLAAALEGGDPEALARYQVPELPSLKQVETVSNHASAAMDVSDGLLIDAARMADASGVSIELQIEAVPLAAPARSAEDALEQCAAGDDYQILMATPPDVELVGFFKIGTVIEGRGLRLSWHGEAIALPEKLGYLHGES